MRNLLPILAMVVMATGCASGTLPDGIRLEGVTWRALTIAGLPPRPNQAPTLTITGSTISGSGGCNRFSGGVRVDAGRLVVDQLAMTAMACLDDAANQREQQFISILSSRPLIGTREGHLVLAGQGGEIVLESPAINAGSTG